VLDHGEEQHLATPALGQVVGADVEEALIAQFFVHDKVAVFVDIGLLNVKSVFFTLLVCHFPT